jgi:hypothetical protein
LGQEPAASVIGRKRPDCLTKMGNKVGYAIVKEEHLTKNRILPQNTVFSAEQSAIIEAIQSKKNNRHEIVIITDSLSTIMAAENRAPTKHPLDTNYQKDVGS